VEQVGPINALELGAILVFAGVPAYWWASRKRKSAIG